MSRKDKAYIVFNNSSRAVAVKGAPRGLLIAEGEAVNGVLYIYDCMVFDGDDITGQSYAQRLDLITRLRGLSVEGFRVVNAGKRFASNREELKTIV